MATERAVREAHGKTCALESCLKIPILKGVQFSQHARCRLGSQAPAYLYFLYFRSDFVIHIYHFIYHKVVFEVGILVYIGFYAASSND